MIFVLIFDASEAFNLAVLRTLFFFSRIRSRTSLRLKEASEAFRHAIAGEEDSGHGQLYLPRAKLPPRSGPRRQGDTAALRADLRGPLQHPEPTAEPPKAGGLQRRPSLTSSPRGTAALVAPEEGQTEKRQPHPPCTFEFKQGCSPPAPLLAPPRRRAGRAQGRRGCAESPKSWAAGLPLSFQLSSSKGVLVSPQ